MDADLSSLLYTILIDIFVLLICHTIYVFVSDATPLQTRLLLARTWQRGVSRPASWLGGLLSTRPHQATQMERQAKAKQAVRDVVITQRIRGLSMDAAAASTAHQRRTPATPKVHRLMVAVDEGDESPEMEYSVRSALTRQTSLSTPRPSTLRRVREEDTCEEAKGGGGAVGEIELAECRRPAHLSRQASLTTLPELPPSPSQQAAATHAADAGEERHDGALPGTESTASSGATGTPSISERRCSRSSSEEEEEDGDDDASLSVSSKDAILLKEEAEHYQRQLEDHTIVIPPAAASIHAATIFEPEDVTMEDLDEYAFVTSESDQANGAAAAGGGGGSGDMEGDADEDGILPKWHGDEDSVAQMLRRALGTELPVIQLIPRAVVQPTAADEEENRLRVSSTMTSPPPPADAPRDAAATVSPPPSLPPSSPSSRRLVHHSSYARHHNRATSNAHALGLWSFAAAAAAPGSPRAVARERAREVAEEARTSPAISHIILAPTLEGFSLKEQTRVRIPRALLRFLVLEPLLERLFPPIRVLGSGALDVAIYLKFAQLLILLVAIMTLVCCSVLVPIHVDQNAIASASSFSAASIASVPEGSRWFLAHFLCAYGLVCLFLFYLKLLQKHAKRATALSATVQDDAEFVASARTLHITHLPLDFTEARLRREIEKLLPSKRYVVQGGSGSGGNGGSTDRVLVVDSSREILSISLYHSVSSLAKLMRKRAKVLTQTERLEILACAVQANPTAHVKQEWLEVLQGRRDDAPEEEAATDADTDATHGHRRGKSIWSHVRQRHPPGVKKQLEHLATKRLKLTVEIVEAVLVHYERMTKDRDPQTTTNANASATGVDDLLGSDSGSRAKTPIFSPDASPTLGPHTAATSTTASSSASSSSSHLFSSLPSSSTSSFRSARGSSPLLVRFSTASGSSISGGGASNSRFCGQAFVSFRSAVAAVDAVTRAAGDATSAWTVRHAPKPSDILFENLHSQGTTVVGCTRWLFANSSLLALVFFVGVPTLILRSITDLTDAESTSLDATTEKSIKLLSNYLSTIVMWAVNWRYMPFMVKKAIDFERHPTRSEYEASRFWKSSLFLFAVMILLPVTALTTVADSLNKGAQSGHMGPRWYQLLSSAFFINSGIYFAQYITHEVFVNVAINGLSLIMYVKRVWRLRRALTAKEFDAAQTPEPIVLQYDRLCAAFGLLLLNAISVPVLLPFGLVYLIVQYWIDSSRLKQFQVWPAQNKGVLPTAALRCILLYIAGWSLLMAALFFSQHSGTYWALGVFFMLLSFGVLATYVWWKFDTDVPVEVRRNAMQMVDEKITMYRKEEEQGQGKEPKDEEKSNQQEEKKGSTAATDRPGSAAAPGGACSSNKSDTSPRPRFIHFHTHRSPFTSSSPSGASSSPSFHHVSPLSPSLCPDCLFRHPVWSDLESDGEVMSTLHARVELIKDQRAKADAIRDTMVEDGFTLMSHGDDHGASQPHAQGPVEDAEDEQKACALSHDTSCSCSSVAFVDFES